MNARSVIRSVAILSALSLTTCGAGYSMPFGYRTTCGVEVQPGSPWSWDYLQRVEDAVNAHFPHVNEASFRRPCEHMTGYKVFFKSAETFTGPYAGKVGLTWCGPKTVYLHEDLQGASRAEIYAHEMAHAVQACHSQTCITSHDDNDHMCWDANGIWGAVAAVKKEVGPE